MADVKETVGFLVGIGDDFLKIIRGEGRGLSGLITDALDELGDKFSFAGLRDGVRWGLGIETQRLVAGSDSGDLYGERSTVAETPAASRSGDVPIKNLTTAFGALLSEGESFAKLSVKDLGRGTEYLADNSQFISNAPTVAKGMEQSANPIA